MAQWSRGCSKNERRSRSAKKLPTYEYEPASGVKRSRTWVTLQWTLLRETDNSQCTSISTNSLKKKVLFYITWSISYCSNSTILRTRWSRSTLWEWKSVLKSSGAMFVGSRPLHSSGFLSCRMKWRSWRIFTISKSLRWRRLRRSRRLFVEPSNSSRKEIVLGD